MLNCQILRDYLQCIDFYEGDDGFGNVVVGIYWTMEYGEVLIFCC